MWLVTASVLLLFSCVSTQSNYTTFKLAVCTPQHVFPNECGVIEESEYIACQCDHCVTPDMHEEYLKLAKLHEERAGVPLHEFHNMQAFVKETTDSISRCLCEHCKAKVSRWKATADKCNNQVGDLDLTSLNRIATVLYDAQSASSAVDLCTGYFIGRILTITIILHSVFMLLAKLWGHVALVKARIQLIEVDGKTACVNNTPPCDNQLSEAEKFYSTISISGLLDYASFMAVSCYLVGMQHSGYLRGVGSAFGWLMFRAGKTPQAVAPQEYTWSVGLLVLIATGVMQVVVAVQYVNPVRAQIPIGFAYTRSAYVTLLAQRQALAWPPRWNIYALLLFLPALGLVIGQNTVREGNLITTHCLFLLIPILLPVVFIRQMIACLAKAPPLPSVNPAPPTQYLKFHAHTGCSGRIPCCRVCAYEGERSWVNLNFKYVESWGVLFENFKYSGRFFVSVYLMVQIMSYFWIGVSLSGTTFIYSPHNVTQIQMITVFPTLGYMLLYICLVLYSFLVDSYNNLYVIFIRIQLIAKIFVFGFTLIPALSDFSVASSNQIGLAVLIIHIVMVVALMIKDYMFFVMGHRTLSKWKKSPKDETITVVDSSPCSNVKSIIKDPSNMSMSYHSMMMSPPSSGSYSDISMLSEYSYEDYNVDGYSLASGLSSRRVSFSTSTTLVLEMKNSAPVLANQVSIAKASEAPIPELASIVMEFTEEIEVDVDEDGYEEDGYDEEGY